MIDNAASQIHSLRFQKNKLGIGGRIFHNEIASVTDSQNNGAKVSIRAPFVNEKFGALS